MLPQLLFVSNSNSVRTVVFIEGTMYNDAEKLTTSAWWLGTRNSDSLLLIIDLTRRFSTY